MSAVVNDPDFLRARFLLYGPQSGDTKAVGPSLLGFVKREVEHPSLRLVLDKLLADCLEVLVHGAIVVHPSGLVLRAQWGHSST